MKKITLFTPILLAIMLFSCDKIAELIQANFNVNPNNIPFTIPAIPADNSSYSVKDSQYFNADSLIKAKESRLSISNIKEATITSIEVNLLTAVDSVHTFKNLDSLKVELSTDGTNYEVVKKFSSSDITSDNNVTVTLSPEFDVLAKVKASTMFYYKFTASNKKKTSNPMNCSAKVNFRIKAGL